MASFVYLPSVCLSLVTCTQEVDIVVAPLVPRLQALEYYDFTTAFDFLFAGVAVRTVDHSLYLYTAFLSPFAYQVHDRLVGLVVKASASRAEDPGFESHLRRDFFGVESYQ